MKSIVKVLFLVLCALSPWAAHGRECAWAKFTVPLNVSKLDPSLHKSINVTCIVRDANRRQLGAGWMSPPIPIDPSTGSPSKAQAVVDVGYCYEQGTPGPATQWDCELTVTVGNTAVYPHSCQGQPNCMTAPGSALVARVSGEVPSQTLSVRPPR